MRDSPERGIVEHADDELLEELVRIKLKRLWAARGMERGRGKT